MKNERARIPTSTYRLQFHAGFTFRDALAILDYLKELGISDVYSSPYFQASPESTHGYDVSDHNRMNPAIGDASDFRALASGLRERGMGQVLDFVPNHMGIGESLNRWWMEVLEDGVASPYASYFDIDWNPGKETLAQRVLLPILGGRYGQVLEKGELKPVFQKGVFFLTYFQTRLPLDGVTYPVILREALAGLPEEMSRELRTVISDFARLANLPDREAGKIAAKNKLGELVEREPEVSEAIQRALQGFEGEEGNAGSFDRLHALLEAQNYRLAYWRVAAEEINYRRFFDINTLAAIRVEIPEVFDAAHALVFELLARGDVTGLRIDHIDGLWNPREYLQRLQDRYAQIRGLEKGSEGLYLVVEKILDLTRERLPSDWPTHGTTGYEFANQVVQFLVDAGGEKRMDRVYRKFTGETETFADLFYEKKSRTTVFSLNSEIMALGRMLDEISEMHRNYRDFTRNTLTFAVREVMACFPVYRTYVTEDGFVAPEDEKVILRAISAARRKNPAVEKPVFDFLRNLLLLRLGEGLTPEQRGVHVRFVMKFQQCSGPVMAKGVEDTAFYIYNRLAALNEVGGNPGCFGIKAREFHRLNAERQESFPYTLLATSTHDTKRSEDVRMRIAVLSEIPGRWLQALKRWAKMNRRLRGRVGGEWAPSRNEEYLLYQTLVGAWPLEPMDAAAREDFINRIQQYMTKALKEAKVNSSWTEPNEEWERAVLDFIEAILSEGKSREFLEDFSAFCGQIQWVGAMNSLTQVTLKCTLPGVPDFYQGTELWDFSLVDPDNRRAVDYGLRRSLLSGLDADEPTALLEDWRSGRIKLFLIQRLLRLRAEHAAFFRNATYEPVKVVGSQADRLIAYKRRWNGQELVVVAPRLSGVFESFPIGDVWQGCEVASDVGRNVLTGEQPASREVSGLLGRLPLGVFFRE